MNVEQVSMSAFRAIWSALHFPNEPNHCGNKVLTLFKNNAMSPFQKSLFDELGTHKNFGTASTVIVEMQNLMMGNSNLMNQVVQTLESGRNDSKIDMPPIEVNNEPEPQYQQSSSNDDGLSVWGVIKFLIGIVALLANIAQCAN